MNDINLQGEEENTLLSINGLCSFQAIEIQAYIIVISVESNSAQKAN